MRCKALALVLVLAVVAAGCGSKKSATKAGGSDSTTTTATSTAATSTGSTSTGNTSSFTSAKNCAQLASIGQKFSKAMAATSGTGTSSVTAVADAYKALAKEAPSEIRSDFETIAAAFGTYADALKKVHYTPGKAPTASQLAAITSLAKTFSSPKLMTAERHLSTWGTKNCSGLTTTTG